MTHRRLVCTVCLRTDFTLEQCHWKHPVLEVPGFPPPRRRLGQSEADAQRQYNAWAQNGWEPHCPEGHILPPSSHERDCIIMALFGETASAKTAYIKALIRHLDIDDSIAPIGITGRLADGFRHTYKEEYLNNNEQTLPILEGRPPRQPVVVELQIRGGESINLLIFDSSGEEGMTVAQSQRQNPAALVADILLFFAAPAALELLPPEVRMRGHKDAQTQENTRNRFHTAIQTAIGNAVKSSKRRAAVIPIFVLAKADRFSTVQDFPSKVLAPRQYRGRTIYDIIAEINAELPELLDFIVKSGGRPLLDKVKSFNGTGRCVAVSGTGNDDDSVDSGFSAKAGASNRTLDPLIIALWERGYLRGAAQ